RRVPGRDDGDRQVLDAEPAVGLRSVAIGPGDVLQLTVAGAGDTAGAVDGPVDGAAHLSGDVLRIGRDRVPRVRCRVVHRCGVHNVVLVPAAEHEDLVLVDGVARGDESVGGVGSVRGGVGRGVVGDDRRLQPTGPATTADDVHEIADEPAGRVAAELLEIVGERPLVAANAVRVVALADGGGAVS